MASTGRRLDPPYIEPFLSASPRADFLFAFFVNLCVLGDFVVNGPGDYLAVEFSIAATLTRRWIIPGSGARKAS